MSTRSIVTSQPDVACDVCGRRLLRGEHPDVFLAGGRRRNVCELCAPRAADEGWLREGEGHAVSLHPARQRRARNLLERFRALREPAPELVADEPAGAAAPAYGDDAESLSYDFLEPAPQADQALVSAHEGVQEQSTRADAHPLSVEQIATSAPSQRAGAAPEAPRSGDLKAQRAIEVFNAGEHPRRVAGIARSLGAPSVCVRPLAESGSGVAIVVAWELCWYRYEVDLGDEALGAKLIAQGTELAELEEQERAANASADDQGALALVASALS